MKRIKWKEYYKIICHYAAMRGTCPKAKVGAIIVKDNNLIATGYNGAPTGMKHCYEVGCINDTEGHCIRSVHAEANAIIKAGKECKGAELFCTHVPCIECCKLIINSGIKKVYYSNEYLDNRAQKLGYKSQKEFLKEGNVEIECLGNVNTQMKLNFKEED